MKTRKVLSVALLVVSTSLVAQAAETPQESIEKISVIGSRTPVEKSTIAGSISYIDAEIIEASGAATVAELLRSFASINLSQSGPVGALTEVRFRGSESNHILVLLDGVEINDIAQGGLVDFAHILVSDIESIELLRGPQSALWGTSAVSGVLSITTKQAAISGQHKISTKLGLGSQSSRQVGVSYKMRYEDFSLATNMNHYRTDGENVAREGDENDGYKNTSLSAIATYHVNKQHKLSANIRSVDFTTEFDDIDFVNTGLPTDALNESQGKQLNALIRWDFSPNNSIWSQSLSYQLSRFASDNYMSDNFSGGTIGKTQRLNWINYIDLGAKDFINIGLDSVKEDFEQSGPIVFGDPNQQQENQTISMLSDGQFELSKGLHASYSIRADKSDEFDDANSFRVGLSYKILPDLQAFISRGKAIKNPTFTERFGFFPGTFVGNSSLVPESSYASEIGFVYAYSSQLNAEITYFDTALENEINGFVFDTESASFTAQNITESSTRKGLEVSLAGDWLDLSWKASYAYLEARTPSEIELRRSRHSGSTTLNYRLSANSNLYFQADYTGSKQDRFFPPFPETARIVGLKPYWLLSANYQQQISTSMTLGLRVDNLLNAGFEDVFGFVGQSRKIMLNLQYELN